jgi:hypothetical protein
MSQKVESYVYIYKLKGDDGYYYQIEGPDDDIIQMTAAALTQDNRLTMAMDVADEFFNDFGGRNQN